MRARDGVETAHGTRHAHGTEGAIGEGASHENGDGGIDADATAHRDASASAADDAVKVARRRATGPRSGGAIRSLATNVRAREGETTIEDAFERSRD